ncbi:MULTISPECIES: hypothetical protein [Haloarcula]|uniref:EamA-like transporter family protein n=1 Tax=Haloarcula pellucida TaxID=1427151 RepID=A0A830GKQ6_9EURY|nr:MULTISPECIES: hypothetical protein [Halomicroarcula]MBX0348738.1 hypothetical protein [Halomicroarcula pellucida]MDS0278506.1 hypothetical protein [Halomicroarcula sp. S1AR25-4]GGN92002.1 hypothetical protein GCM10009030_15720 [Halomicroarcula pellucida]
MRPTLWALVALSSLFGAAGNITMKVITNDIGDLSLAKLTQIDFLVEFFLMPLVLFSIGAAFVGRLLLFAPLSELEVGIVTAVALLLWALFTAIGDVVLFGTDYNPMLLFGFGLSLVSIVIIVTNS